MSATRVPKTPGGRAEERRRDDEGRLWIRMGIVLGVLFYGFMVVLWAAGFTAILPFVVIPLVLVALIGSNALLGGPRRRQQLDPRPVGPTDRGADPSAYRSGAPASEQVPGVIAEPATDGTPAADGTPATRTRPCGPDGGKPGTGP